MKDTPILTRSMAALALLMGVLPGADRKNVSVSAVGRPTSPRAVISGMSATPSTVAFLATDPDLGTVSGTAATVTWSALGGLFTNTWTLTVQAAATTFTGCATVPVSAVTVGCTSASATGVIAGTGNCAAAFPLSTSPQQVASGIEGTVAGTFTVNISFALADKWKYVAASACTLTLTYSANTP